ncbi:MAG: NTP transferase domain-containing protein [Desulfobacterales bacterium]|nr:NTP transferase domain-containing protein [Desulfobacterales bacterium]
MKAVILCGGRGTRLKSLTDNRPKPMVTIMGKPFLEHLLLYIKSYKIDNILLLVGYLGKQIEDYFGDGSTFGLHIEYAYDENLLGTGGALKNAEEKINQDFLLINGDTYLPIDYQVFQDYAISKNAIGTLTVFSSKNNMLPYNISVGKNHYILSYNKKDPSKMTHVDGGLIYFKKDVLSFIPPYQICSLEEEIFPQLIKINQLVSFPIDQQFYDMGTSKGLKELQDVLEIKNEGKVYSSQ